jgi:uncharacterized protein
MKIVFDTNVILSAFLTEGMSHKVFEHCIAFEELYASDFILSELKKVLNKKFKIKDDIIKTFINYISSNFKIVNPAGQLPNKCRDKSDNNILHLANIINAKYIITGDKDLLDLKHYKNIQITSPRDFYQINILEKK